MAINKELGFQIIDMTEKHWDELARIYAAGISSGLATFESEPPAREKFLRSKIAALNIVALSPSDEVLGWAAAGPISERPAYRGVIEHSVYVDPKSSGRGVGQALLNELVSRARELCYWTIQSSIIAQNKASRSLHLKAGFREVGRRERIAQGARGGVAGQWLDTYLYELRL
ncbi:N-acetyltransferase family protein [Glutamicibacter mishrai]|uniref:GNAT family N-acetyltransferase n=1 Tax=Glutamicibacter mishrai TaxID=1775880 RepID=UPI0032EABA7E